jgi:hypothetical protein
MVFYYKLFLDCGSWGTFGAKEDAKTPLKQDFSRLESTKMEVTDERLSGFQS